MIFESKRNIGDKVWQVYIKSGDFNFDINIKENVIEEIIFFESSKGIEEDYRFRKSKLSDNSFEVFDTYEKAKEYVISKIIKQEYKEEKYEKNSTKYL